MANDQRRFEVVGQNLITICNKMLSNQNLCKLLYYTQRNPLSQPNIPDTDFLMDHAIATFPKIPDHQEEKGSFIVVLMNEFIVLPENQQIKEVAIGFHIMCPNEDWSLNEKSLRPFLIMSELDGMFQNFNLKGIGKLKLESCSLNTFSEYYSGYVMGFTNYEFN